MNLPRLFFGFRRHIRRKQFWHLLIISQFAIMRQKELCAPNSVVRSPFI